MKKITVILGSVRTARAGEAVAGWVKKHTDQMEDKINIEHIDLKKLNLPFMDEPVSPMGSDNYVHEHTKKWSRIIGESDGFIIITPEYNHGVSPVLKNAIDFLYKEWKDKPVGLVGYGGSGARDSIRQLREVLAFVGMKAMEDQIGIGKIWEAFDENGVIKDDHVHGDLEGLLKQLTEKIGSAITP